MRLALYGKTALSILMTLNALPRDHAVGQDTLRHCGPTDQAVRYALERWPRLGLPLHLLTDRWERTVGETVSLHSLRTALPSGSLVKIDNGIYAPTPELCLVQLARHCSDHELILYGGLLCGSFAIDPDSATGLRSRDALTDTASIADFLERCPAVPGTKALRRCLPHITEGAASPPEVFLRMVLVLSHRLGGFNLTGATINRQVNLGKRAQNIAGRLFLVPDLCWPEHRLDVEYDADSVHLTSRQALLDATKRLALEAEGFKVVTVTSLQLGNSHHMTNIAREVGCRLGRTMRIRSTRFTASQQALFNLDWSLQTLFPSEGRKSRETAHHAKDVRTSALP